MQGYIQVYEADSEAESALYRQWLEQAGVPVIEQPAGEGLAIAAIYHVPPQRFALYVRPEDEMRAREVIRAYAAPIGGPTEAAADPGTPQQLTITKSCTFTIGRAGLWLTLVILLAGLLFAAIQLLKR